ncbi:cytochrome c oxidase subunit II [Methylovirgula ligni]|uniref:Cytochrome aa3 subunit 2 n=1 Tax=Methylovirgula ligni TaxID=569860 RepID=A0A3D9YTE3_9HYPH|nr:cytochrome c oxidase subunit II [Methylovirgula ligni]QAY96389.1 cytochrome c oxidase subunit II [Methylovirgula ligni]REF85887.1 cytochrome c oxidase subunit 2 [Methylovirgula ligni]
MTPLSYLSGFGAKAYPVTALTWGLLIISILVVVIVTALVFFGVLVRRAPRDATVRAVAVQRSGEGLGWLGFGVGVSTIVLVISAIWTMEVLAKINAPPSGAMPLAIEITGQQWWWKARYLNGDPSKILTTADEFHIPVGRPVRIQLIGADVIHSFWVPALTGKTETIPGQTNVTWLEADKPGRYRGQCTEYCGQQHAHMAFFVIAEPPSDFQRWLDAQLKPAATPSSPVLVNDQNIFVQRCGECHTVRGSMAGGSVAPDLTHLMSRETLAADTLPNTPGALAGWIADPQAQKPGTNMPDLYLSGPELTAVTTYLRTLQ